MDAQAKQLIQDNLLIHHEEVQQGYTLKVRDIFKEAHDLIEHPYITQKQLLEAADSIKGWLPGWARREQQKLCVAIFKAAGCVVEGWEN